jgi:hypothetical protein
MEKHEIKHKHESHHEHKHTDKHEDVDDEEKKIIEEKQTKESGKNLVKIIAYIILIIVAIFAVQNLSTRYAQDDQSFIYVDQYVYNGFNCTSHDNFHTCKLYVVETEQWYDYEFRASPKDLEDIPVYGNVKQIVNKSNTEYIHIAFPANLDEEMQNAKMAIATYQVGRLFGDLFEYKIPAGAAIIPGTDIYSQSNEDVPLIDCNNATNKTSVLMFMYGDENSVIKRGNCYTLTGTTEDDLVRVAERFSFTVLGVMQPNFPELE